VPAVVTVPQINSIFPAITGAVAGNQAAYQAYIDANPNLFSAPATAAEVQAMVNAVNSSNGSAIVSSYSCSTASTGIMTAGTAVSGVTQTITATVITIGTYSISTTANGVTFAASGTFAGTGNQNIVLTASGTPTAIGNNSFVLNTNPNCSFSRSTNAPFPANITLSEISPYFIVSVYDQDYAPYTVPTVAASLSTPVAANGVNEPKIINIQGTLTPIGVTVRIPYTVVNAPVNLPAFTQTITIPADYTQDGISRNITLSYGGATLSVGSGNIVATLSANGTLNVKKLDIQTGIGNDALGWLLAQFTYSTNNSGGYANFSVRAITPIPDINVNDSNHFMFYLPITGADGRTWLNNNLGAYYSNVASTFFNPAQQATSATDFKAYGSLFQWGRYADGHELVNWINGFSGTFVNGYTATQSTTDTPANSMVISSYLSGSVFYNWRNPSNNSLWQGVSGINNPCPYGYRVPTLTEMGDLLTKSSITNSNTALNSNLKFTMPGYHLDGSYDITYTGQFGFYWSSTNTTDAEVKRKSAIYTTGVGPIYGATAIESNSVRCIKD
jgi:hypothetical protein